MESFNNYYKGCGKGGNPDELYMEDTGINAFLVLIEGQLQMFWYDVEKNEVLNPSVPIGDSLDEAYSSMTDRHIQFINMKVKAKDPNDVKLEVVDDYQKFDFYSIKKDRIELNRPVLEAMEEGSLEKVLEVINKDVLKKVQK